MIYDYRQQEDRVIRLAVMGSVISVALTIIWFLTAYLWIIHHYGR